MKNYLLLIFLFYSTILFAQEQYQEVVYLKNGSIIRGVIIEEIPQKSIKIQTEDKNIFIFQMDEIAKLTKEVIPSTTNQRDLGYHLNVDVGYQIGAGSWATDRLKLDITNYYQLTDIFALGGGIGARYYTDFETLQMPLFVSTKINMSKKAISPYFALDLGYTFSLSNEFDGIGMLR